MQGIKKIYEEVRYEVNISEVSTIEVRKFEEEMKGNGFNIQGYQTGSTFEIKIIVFTSGLV